MGILSKIFGKIFPSAHAAPAPATATVGIPAGAAPAAAPSPSAAAATATQPVDIEAVLDGLASKNSQTLNWRTSIVDLMKLVGMESSLQERKDLADELGFTGDKGDSAAMNIWLHKQVMQRMAANGGKVPANLMD